MSFLRGIGAAAVFFLGGAALGGGERVYQLYCATCHGLTGDGKGPSAAVNGPPRPRDFTLGLYAFRSTPSGKLPAHQDLVRTVAVGVPGTSMPGWGKVLPAKDLDEVASYLETFSPRFAAEPASDRTPLEIPAAPGSSAESVARGRNIFLAVACWSCHGVKGLGDGPVGVALAATGVVPADFTRPHRKSGERDEDIYRTLSTGLDGTAMPSFKDTLIVVRELESGVRGLESQLGEQDLVALRQFLTQQRPREEFDALPEEQRTALIAGWRWDLVNYVQSLKKTSWWRVALGL